MHAQSLINFWFLMGTLVNVVTTEALEQGAIEVRSLASSMLFDLHPKSQMGTLDTQGESIRMVGQIAGAM